MAERNMIKECADEITKLYDVLISLTERVERLATTIKGKIKCPLGTAVCACIECTDDGNCEKQEDFANNRSTPNTAVPMKPGSVSRHNEPVAFSGSKDGKVDT